MESTKKLNVLVVGSGGREHAIVKAVKKSPLLGRLVCTPANGGIARDCETAAVSAEDIDGIVALAKNGGFDLVISGPEVPLSMGLADKLRAEGIAVYGPNKDGATLEASKAFSKNFLKKYSVPTAAGENFTDIAKAVEYIEKAPYDVVIKASGLAAGKGVVIPENKAEAIAAAREMLEGGAFGDSGREIVVEEKMDGEEASIMLMVCGDKYIMLPASQDHKRVGEGDTGLNTGGMGAYAPAAVATKEVLDDVRKNIIAPTLAGLKTEGIDYRGTLYVGIMITKTGAKVVEFNVRFGDPECQVLMPLIESDALELMNDIANGKLDESKVKISDGFAAIVVMCAAGYPNKYAKGAKIYLPADSEIPDGAWIIHAGTKASGGDILTAGGRVLGLVGTGATLPDALEDAYALCKKTSFDGAFYRRDIAHRELRRMGLLK